MQAGISNGFEIAVMTSRMCAVYLLACFKTVPAHTGRSPSPPSPEPPTTKHAVFQSGPVPGSPGPGPAPFPGSDPTSPLPPRPEPHWPHPLPSEFGAEPHGLLCKKCTARAPAPSPEPRHIKKSRIRIKVWASVTDLITSRESQAPNHVKFGFPQPWDQSRRSKTLQARTSPDKLA